MKKSLSKTVPGLVAAGLLAIDISPMDKEDTVEEAVQLHAWSWCIRKISPA